MKNRQKTCKIGRYTLEYKGEIKIQGGLHG